MATNQRAPAPSVKRLMKEARQMAKNYDKTGDIYAQPIGDGDNLFDWHFTIRGPRDSPFENGIYHGRLLFPPDYPMKPPEIFLLNVSGRFETNVKICLSISGYHPETWLPSWSINTALIALQAFFVTDAKGAIGGINWPEDARKAAAMRTHAYNCTNCGLVKDILDISGQKPETEQKVSAEKKIIVSDDDKKQADDKKPDQESIEKIENVVPEKNSNSENNTNSNRTAIAKAREARRQKLELEMMRTRQAYQRNDLMSFFFLILVIALLGFLGYRRYNNEMPSLTYTDSTNSNGASRAGAASGEL